jgi:hypothetical protein
MLPENLRERVVSRRMIGSNDTVTMYKSKLTKWSTKIDEANQKYRQIQNRSYVSFAEGQDWLYNHCTPSFESLSPMNLKVRRPA